MVAEVLSQGLTDVASTVANEYLQAKRDARAQRYNQENMRLAQKLNLESAFKSVAQSTAALRAAGINPALAVNGQTQAVGVSNPSGPHSSVPLNKMDYSSILMAKKELALLDAQKANIEADTAKKAAETDETRERTPTYSQNIKESESRVGLNESQKENLNALTEKYGAEWLMLGEEYKRKLDADSFASKALKNRFNALASKAREAGQDDYASYLEDLSEKVDDMTIGALYGLREFASYVNDLDEYEKEMLFRAVQKEISKMQLQDGTLLYDIAHMPAKEFDKLLAEIADIGESRDLKKATREISIPADAEYKRQSTATTRHNDFVGNIKDGNYADAAWSRVPDLLHLLGEGAFIYALRGRGASSSGPTSLPYSSMSPKEVARQLELSKDKIKALQQAKRSAENNKKLGDAYREKKALEERLRNFRGRDYMQ